LEDCKCFIFNSLLLKLLNCVAWATKRGVESLAIAPKT
jgi:hypothetical protein